MEKKSIKQQGIWEKNRPADEKGESGCEDLESTPVGRKRRLGNYTKRNRLLRGRKEQKIRAGYPKKNENL